MAESYRLHIVTPTGEVLDESVVELTAPGLDGEFGVLPRHARYMTALGIGALRYVREDGTDGLLAVAGGFAEVTRSGVNILAQTAEDAEKIDIARAEAALQRAQTRLDDIDETMDPERASLAIERSMLRLRVAKARGIKPTRTTIRTMEAPIPDFASDEE